MASDTGPKQAHVKANYIEIIKRIVPEFYDETEYRLFGEEEDLQYNVLAKILYVAKNASSLISAPNKVDYSTFSSNQAFIPYFVPFNKKSECSPRDFENNVLVPLGKGFKDFKSVSEFSSFIITSALPKFALNNVATSFAQSYSATTNTEANTVAKVQDELLSKLGWVYLLNTSGEINSAASICPSSVLASSLNEELFYGKTLKTSDGVRMLFKWLGLNIQGGQAPWNEVANTLLPSPFSSPSSTFSDNYWASGGQLVSSLDTLINVWVNEEDPNSTYFRDIVNASLLGLNVQRMENKGPMGKMLKAIAYAFYDVKNTVRDIQFLLDIEECPEEFLQYLGRYLGWTFFSDDPDKWREQLKQAIYLYKAKGTRQALNSAVNMIIPSSIYSPGNDVSGLQELWESYFPNLIYYVIKTETDFGKSPLGIFEIAKEWNSCLEASGFDFKLTNFDRNNPDNNARFLVDYILLYLDRKHNFLNIGRQDYKDSFFLQSQVSANSQTPSYFHRGKNIPIPPWEEHRFYQNCLFTDNIIKDFSSLLARPQNSLGLGLETSTAHTIAQYISDSVSIKGEVGLNEVGYGSNQTFKFMTSSLQLPYNYGKIIREGNIEGMSVFDFWNSKSSEVHTKLDADQIEFSANNYVNVAETKLGRKAIPVIVDIFRQFAPFHVLNKIFVGKDFFEDYYPNSSSLDIEVVNTIQSDMDQLNSSYSYDGFPLFSGTGDFVGIGPSIYNPKQGRFIPSATVHTTDFQVSAWNGATETDDGQSVSAIKYNQKSYRTAGRRRNLKYKFTGWSNTRRGLNQPTPTDFFSASSTNPTRGLHVSGFFPKGFNFSAQAYADTSGQFSGVYSQYNTSSTSYFGYEASSHFPVRNITDIEPNASSFNSLRDVFGSQILRALTEIFIRRGKYDDRWLRFTNEGYKNFKFGTGVIKLYNEYNTKFKRQLRNTVLPNTKTKFTRYAGGFNILSHVFGPGFLNNDFTIAGNIVFETSSAPFKNSTNTISNSYPSWSSVVATRAISDRNIFIPTDGSRRDLESGILQGQAFGTYEHPLDTFERPNVLEFSNDTLLSGVSFTAPNVNSIAVWNYPGSQYNVDLYASSGITLIQRSSTEDPKQAIRVRFPFDGNKNLAYNGDFRFAPIDDTRNDPVTSAIAGWKFTSYDRTPEIYGELRIAAVADTIAYVPNTDLSSLPKVYIKARGLGASYNSCIGRPKNPALVSNISPLDKTTPKNLRALDPNTRYQLSFEASSNLIGGSTDASCCFAVINTTKSKYWNEIYQTWISFAGDTYYATNVRGFAAVSSVNTVDPLFPIYKANFITDYSFEKGDSYELWITPTINDTDGPNYHEVLIQNLKIQQVEADQTGRFFNGSKGNKLFPNQNYKVSVTAKVAETILAELREEMLYARVVVEQKPFLGNGWEQSFCRSWAYNWNNKRWEESKSMRINDQWTKLKFDSVRPETKSFEFHTLNSRTPLGYRSISRSGPLGGYFASAGPVHDENSVYYIEFSKPLNTGEFNGITLLNVNLINKEYNIYAEDYTKKNFQDVFEFFDDLNVSKSSRNAMNSSGTYMLSGGSRSEYLEHWGGSHSATNGNFGFKDNAG